VYLQLDKLRHTAGPLRLHDDDLTRLRYERLAEDILLARERVVVGIIIYPNKKNIFPGYVP